MSTRRPGSPTCSLACPITRPSAFTSCCPGIGVRRIPLKRLDLKAPSILKTGLPGGLHRMRTYILRVDFCRSIEMAPRANWKGYLRLSLVSCPIALYPASSLSEKVSFNRLNRKTGNRLKQQNVDSETGEVVPREDIARGYEVAKGQYLIVEDEELDAVQVESTRTIEIDQFVPKSEIDERYIDSPYYIAPDGQVGQDAFAVIRDTISKLNMVGLGRVVLTRREHVIALEPKGRGLMGLTLRYPYEVRDEASYFEDIPEL